MKTIIISLLLFFTVNAQSNLLLLMDSGATTPQADTLASNQILNGDMELAFTGNNEWESKFGATVTRSTGEQVHGGTYSAKTVTAGGGTGIGNIYEVSAKADLINDLWDNIGSVSLEVIQESFTTINTYVDELSESVGGFSIENFKTDIETITTETGKLFDPLITLIQEGGDLPKYITNTTTLLDTLGSTFPKTAQTITDSINTVMKNWKDKLDEMNKEKKMINDFKVENPVVTPICPETVV